MIFFGAAKPAYIDKRESSVRSCTHTRRISRTVPTACAKQWPWACRSSAQTWAGFRLSYAMGKTVSSSRPAPRRVGRRCPAIPASLPGTAPTARNSLPPEGASCRGGRHGGARRLTEILPRTGAGHCLRRDFDAAERFFRSVGL